MSRDSKNRSPGRVRAGLATLRGAPPPASLVAAVAAFSAVIGISTALAGSPANSELAVEKDGQYPATPRVVVNSGTIPGVGEYELLVSRDYKGGLCTGLRLKGGAPGGGDVLGEGCGGPEDLNIGKMTAGDGSWTILHGKVPGTATKLTVTGAEGGSTLDLTPVEDGKGVDGRFVVKKLDGQVGRLQFDAVDSRGTEVASESLR